MQQLPGLQLLQQALQVALLAHHERNAAHSPTLVSWRQWSSSCVSDNEFTQPDEAVSYADAESDGASLRDSIAAARDGVTREGAAVEGFEAKPAVQAAAAELTDLCGIVSEAAIRVSKLGDVQPQRQLLLEALDVQLAVFRSVQQQVQTAERPTLLALLAANMSSSAHALCMDREQWEVAKEVSMRKRQQSAAVAVFNDASLAAHAKTAALTSCNVTAALLPHLLACRAALSGPAACEPGRGSSVGAAVTCVLGSEYVAAAAPAAALAAAGQAGVLMLQVYQQVQGHLQMMGPGSMCVAVEVGCLDDDHAASEGLQSSSTDSSHSSSSSSSSSGCCDSSSAAQGCSNQQGCSGQPTVQEGDVTVSKAVQEIHPATGCQVSSEAGCATSQGLVARWKQLRPGVVLLLEAALRQEGQQSSSSSSRARDPCLSTVGLFGLDWDLRAEMRTFSSATSEAALPGRCVRGGLPGGFMITFLRTIAQLVKDREIEKDEKGGLLTALAQLQPHSAGSVQQSRVVQQQQQQRLGSQSWVPPPLPASSEPEAIFSLCCSFLKCLDTTAGPTASPAAAAATAQGRETRSTGSDAGCRPHSPSRQCSHLLQQLTALIGSALCEDDGWNLKDATISSNEGTGSSSSAPEGMTLLTRCVKWQLLSARACYTAGAWLQQHASKLQDGSSQLRQADQDWMYETEVLSSCSCLAAWTCSAVQQLTQLQAHALAATAAAAPAAAAASPSQEATDTAAGVPKLPKCVAAALQLLPLQLRCRVSGGLDEQCEAAMQAVQQAKEEADERTRSALHTWYSEKQQLAMRLAEVVANAKGWNQLSAKLMAAIGPGAVNAAKARNKLLPVLAALLSDIRQASEQLRGDLGRAQQLLQQPLPGELYR
jgi:hypothetical protein